MFMNLLLRSSHGPLLPERKLTRGRLVGLTVAPVTIVGLGTLCSSHHLPPLPSILDCPHLSQQLWRSWWLTVLWPKPSFQSGPGWSQPPGVILYSDHIELQSGREDQEAPKWIAWVPYVLLLSSLWVRLRGNLWLLLLPHWETKSEQYCMGWEWWRIAILSLFTPLAGERQCQRLTLDLLHQDSSTGQVSSVWLL